VIALAIVNNAAEYNDVYDVYVPIAIGVFVLFTGLIVFFAIRGRFRAPERASRRHEHNPLEISYAVLLACVVAFLLYVTYSAEHQIDTVSMTEKPYVTIDVVGAKWEWVFRYPRYGITHESGTVGRQALVVPINEPVRFKITSRDVIHSFWLPVIDYKRDAIPGATEVAILDFDRTGVTEGHCAQFCGLRHADMWFYVDAVTPARFMAWARSHGRSTV
jgi:cytochrome c oxidase subunit 2